MKSKIVWLNLTGSGNKTTAHILRNNRMTIMLCAFEGKLLALRLYAISKIYYKQENTFQNYFTLFLKNTGAR